MQMLFSILIAALVHHINGIDKAVKKESPNPVNETIVYPYKFECPLRGSALAGLRMNFNRVSRARTLPEYGCRQIQLQGHASDRFIGDACNWEDNEDSVNSTFKCLRKNAFIAGVEMLSTNDGVRWRFRCCTLVIIHKSGDTVESVADVEVFYPSCFNRTVVAFLRDGDAYFGADGVATEYRVIQSEVYRDSSVNLTLCQLRLELIAEPNLYRLFPPSSLQRFGNGSQEYSVDSHCPAGSVAHTIQSIYGFNAQDRVIVVTHCQELTKLSGNTVSEPVTCVQFESHPLPPSRDWKFSGCHRHQALTGIQSRWTPEDVRRRFTLICCDLSSNYSTTFCDVGQASTRNDADWSYTTPNSTVIARFHAILSEQDNYNDRAPLEVQHCHHNNLEGDEPSMVVGGRVRKLQVLDTTYIDGGGQLQYEGSCDCKKESSTIAVCSTSTSSTTTVVTTETTNGGTTTAQHTFASYLRCLNCLDCPDCPADADHQTVSAETRKCPEGCSSLFG